MIAFPELDPRNEEQIVSDVIDNLPPEISDRNRWTPVVKIIEALGALYAGVLFYLNQWPDRLQLAVLNLLGLSQNAAQSASVSLTFTKDNASGDLIIPAGTIVKDKAGIDAVKFATQSDLLIADTVLAGQVAASAITAGASGNITPNVLSKLDQSITGIASVDNPLSGSGGVDQEPIASVIARAPLAIRSQERAVTIEDFEYHSNNNDGVERARSAGNAGSVTTFIVALDQNEVPNAPLQTTVRADLLARTTPGVSVNVIQQSIRLLSFPTIEIELAAGFNVVTVKTEIETSLALLINVFDRIATDGFTIEQSGWPFGKTLFANTVICAVNEIDGVERVGVVSFSSSDDYGTSWSAVSPLASIAAGRNGNDDSYFGLLHFDTNEPLSLVLL